MSQQHRRIQRHYLCQIYVRTTSIEAASGAWSQIYVKATSTISQKVKKLRFYELLALTKNEVGQNTKIKLIPNGIT